MWDFAHQFGAYGYNSEGAGGTNSWGLGGVWNGASMLGGDSAFAAVRESDVLSPSQMIGIGDAPIMSDGTYVEGWSDLREGFNSDYQNSFSTNLNAGQIQLIQIPIARRHGGKWNMLFCDGHVSNFSTKQLFDYSDDSVLLHWNKDGLAHR